ncbi:MAG: hypothetical protein LLG14_18515 [Nocardiaceae bacterium]|nr:hypothetical protein [Nocardiaceae bacterium]
MIALLDKIFRDQSGRIVLWQWPSIPLICWGLLKVAALVSGGHLQSAFSSASTAFLFVWAYLELAQGVNYFRRALGAIVLLAIGISFFR